MYSSLLLLNVQILLSVRNIFKNFGFDLIDAVAQKTHGGSMRYVIARSNQRKIKDSVKRLINKECWKILNAKITKRND